MNKRYWYAVQKDENDSDWGTGSYNYDEAVTMAKQEGCSIIAVIEEGNDPICVEVIRDF